MSATRADSGQEEPDRISLDALASGHGRIYQAGRDQTVNEITLPDGALRPVGEVVAPHGLVNVPGRSQVFVGRGDELAELSAVLDVEHGGVVIAAVHGLGGVGKSTLAARYAVTAAGEANPVWWITADTIEAVQAGLAGLTVALQPELSVLPLKVLAALSPLDDRLHASRELAGLVADSDTRALHRIRQAGRGHRRSGGDDPHAESPHPGCSAAR